MARNLHGFPPQIVAFAKDWIEMTNRRSIAFAGLAALSALAMSIPHAASASDHTSYILFAQGSDSTTMSGSIDDIRRARALRVGSEALLYVRQDGAAYVIRDPATLRAARALFQPQEELGAQQAELGSRQAALGSRQAQLGAQQARLGARQADATPREAAALAEQQEELGRRQDELGQQQDALGRQQDALGREQDRLGRIADQKLQALVADAIRRGLAKRVD
jgi:bla regulator protein blaR1